LAPVACERTVERELGRVADTEMVAGIDVPKTPPADVASGLLDGLTADEEDIFPDPNATAMAAMWWSDPKSFERAFAA
jgi:hypothetical protein